MHVHWTEFVNQYLLHTFQSLVFSSVEKVVFWKFGNVWSQKDLSGLANSYRFVLCSEAEYNVEWKIENARGNECASSGEKACEAPNFLATFGFGCKARRRYNLQVCVCVHMCIYVCMCVWVPVSQYKILWFSILCKVCESLCECDLLAAFIVRVNSYLFYIFFFAFWLFLFFSLSSVSINGIK